MAYYGEILIRDRVANPEGSEMGVHHSLNGTRRPAQLWLSINVTAGDKWLDIFFFLWLTFNLLLRWEEKTVQGLISLRVINESVLLISGLPCLFLKKCCCWLSKGFCLPDISTKQHWRQFHPLWPTTLLICLLILLFSNKANCIAVVIWWRLDNSYIHTLVQNKFL